METMRGYEQRPCHACGGNNTAYNYAAQLLACWHCQKVFDVSPGSQFMRNMKERMQGPRIHALRNDATTLRAYSCGSLSFDKVDFIGIAQRIDEGADALEAAAAPQTQEES